MRFTNDFTLYAEPKNKMGKTVYYVRIRDKSGRRHSGRSTGETSRSAARRKVLALIAEGRFTPACAQTFSITPSVACRFRQAVLPNPISGVIP